MTELMQLSGSVIKEESKKRNGLQQEMDMEQLVYASVMYAVGTRCGFDLSVQERDFSQIVNIKDEEIITVLVPLYAMSPVVFLENLVVT